MMNGFFLSPSQLLSACLAHRPHTKRLPRRSQTKAAEISVPSVKLQPVSPNYAKLQFSAFLPELQLRKTPPAPDFVHEPLTHRAPSFHEPALGAPASRRRVRAAPTIETRRRDAGAPRFKVPMHAQKRNAALHATESHRILVNPTKSRLRKFFSSSGQRFL